jgi:hypothetical protein
LQLLSDGIAIEFNLGSDDGTQKEMKSFFFSTFFSPCFHHHIDGRDEQTLTLLQRKIQQQFIVISYDDDGRS